MPSRISTWTEPTENQKDYIVYSNRAAGWVRTENGVVIDSCPYFSFMRGKQKAQYEGYKWRPM